MTHATLSYSKHLSHIDASNAAKETYAVATDGTTYEVLFLDGAAGITDALARSLGAFPIDEVFPAREIAVPYLEAYVVPQA